MNVCAGFHLHVLSVSLCVSSVSVTLSLAFWLLFWSCQFPSHCVRLCGPDTNLTSLSVSLYLLSLSGPSKSLEFFLSAPLKSLALSFSTFSRSPISLGLLSITQITFVVTLSYLNVLITTSAGLVICGHGPPCKGNYSSPDCYWPEVCVVWLFYGTEFFCFRCQEVLWLK